MHQLIKSLIFLAAVGLSLSAATEQLYKWVDQRGVTHYSKTVPTDPDAKLNKTIAIRGSDPAAAKRQQPQPESNPGSQQKSKPELAVSGALGSDQQLQHQAQQQKAQQQNCLTARNKLTTLENAGRVRELDPTKGQYRYLPDEEKLAQINKMRDYIRHHCGH